ncbi:MAG: hypothetical protein IT184_11320 [Acidobacteria bacterium]|nr:hypothetical protein [Acidobacteriota bacterium]
MAAALAATQNPPLALVVPIVAAAALAWRPSLSRDARLVAALPFAFALAALHPAYYLVRLGRLTNLSGNVGWHWPMPREFSTVLFDPNLGLAPAFPALALVAAAALVVLLLRHPAKLWAPDVLVACGAFVVFSWSLTQVANVNHGGTPGMSRYGIWFVPLAIPLLAALERASPRSPRWIAPIAIASACWCAVVYRPALPEAGATPTRLAMWLWTRHPALTTPLPEVFTERLLGAEDDWLPISTPGCEKILIVGRGPRLGLWPVWCAPAEPPAACVDVGRLCYANRRADGGYDFVVWRSAGGEVFRLRRELVWQPRALPHVRSLVERLGATGLSPTEVGTPGAAVAAAGGIARAFLLQSRGIALLYVDGIDASSRVTFPPNRRVTGFVVDPEDGHALQTFDVGAGDSTPLRLPSSPSPVLVVLTDR